MVNERFKEVLSIYLDSAILVDCKGKILGFNDSFKKNFPLKSVIFEYLDEDLAINILKMCLMRSSSAQFCGNVSNKVCQINIVPVNFEDNIYYIVTFNYLSENPLINTLNSYYNYSLLKITLEKIVHDINNSMSGITGGVSVFEYRALKNEPLSPDIILSNLKLINTSVNKTLNIVGELKNLLPRDKNYFEFELKNIITTVLTNIDNKKISIDIDVDESHTIYSDSDIVEEILFQVIKNSYESVLTKKDEIDYFEGEINIKSVNFHLSDDINYCKLTIRDNGIGIPSDKLNEVYYPYFSLNDKKMKRGLGLTYGVYHSLYLGIIMELRSEPKEYTEVTFYFPVK
jgi:signal transduction histidine kinase